MAEGFLIKRRVQFAETDMAGVLHFANYYRLMEEVEHAFWRSKGLSVICRDGDLEVSWPRVASSCEYFAPARFEDELELELSIARIGDQSVSYEVEFRCRNERLAKGSTTAVCCTMVDGRFQSVRIPDSLRRILCDASNLPTKGS